MTSCQAYTEPFIAIVRASSVRSSGAAVTVMTAARAGAAAPRAALTVATTRATDENRQAHDNQQRGENPSPGPSVVRTSLRSCIEKSSLITIRLLI